MPWEPWLNPYWKFNIGGPVHPSRQTTGVDSVVSLSALYSAVRLISDGVASLPLRTYRNLAPGGFATVAERMMDPNVESRSPELVPNPPLLSKPSVIDTPFDWIFKCMTSLLLQGNAWGLITARQGIMNPQGFGYPTMVEWLPPQDVTVEDDQQQPWNPMRSRVYFLGRLMDRNDLVHVKAFSVAGRTEAISPMRAFMNLVAQGKEALAYSHSWFKSGGFPPSTFQNTAEEVSPEQAREIRRILTDTIRQREPLVYGRDWDWKPVQVPQNEAAFIQAMQLNAAQIAAIYGVPPERIGGLRGSSLTYSTQEQETLSLIVDTLRPWLVRLEHAFYDLMPSTQYCRFQTDAMLKTDIKTRHEIYQIDRNIGYRTVDEMRETEDRPPLGHQIGDDPLPLQVEVAMARTTKAVPEQVAKYVQVLSPVAWHGTVTGILPPGGEQVNPPDTGFEKILPDPSVVAPPSGDQGGGGAGGEEDQPSSKSADQQTATHFITSPGGAHIPIGGGARGSEPGTEWRMFGPAHLKASHAERQDACRLLLAHKDAGRLTDDEFAERTPKALKARTRGSLDQLFGDLPVISLPVEIRTEVRPAMFGAAAQAAVTMRRISEDDDQALAELAATNGRH